MAVFFNFRYNLFIFLATLQLIFPLLISPAQAQELDEFEEFYNPDDGMLFLCALLQSLLFWKMTTEFCRLHFFPVSISDDDDVGRDHSVPMPVTPSSSDEFERPSDRDDNSNNFPSEVGDARR